MPWGSTNWSDLPESEGSYSLNANKVVNSIGHTLDDFATAAKLVNEDLSNAILGIKTAFDDAVNTFDTTYAVTLTGSPYIAPNLSMTLPVLPPAPTLPPLGARPDAPSGPNTAVPLLDTAAYTGAFALAREAAEQEAQHAQWEAGAGAAASGVGMPFAARQGAVKQIAQARAKALQQAALTQATLQATHVREDKRWAYEQQLVHWAKECDTKLDWWMKENTTLLSLWSTEYKGKLEQFAAEMTRLTTLVEEKKVQYQFWDATNKNALEKSEKMATDARAIQALIVATGEKAVYAYAGALAEQFKAWLAAVSYSLSGSASPTNATYAP